MRTDIVRQTAPRLVAGANRYAEVISTVECRNLAQLSSFVHDIV